MTAIFIKRDKDHPHGYAVAHTRAELKTVIT